MDKAKLKKRVDAIIASGDDDYQAHLDEDKLHLALIQEFCPEWVQAEITRLSEADFSRWCA